MKEVCQLAPVNSKSDRRNKQGLNGIDNEKVGYRTPEP